MSVRIVSTTRRRRATKLDLKHIVKLKSGKHLVKVPNGRDLQGKLQHKRYGPFADVADAIKARDEHLLALAKGVEAVALGRPEKAITLREQSKHWLYVQVANDNASTTASKYAGVFEMHVLPYLGELALSDTAEPRLTKRAIELWRETLKGKGVGAATINYALKRLRTCISAAIADGHLGENVATKVAWVEEARTERESNFADYPKLGASAGDHYLAAVIPVGVDTGLRASEFTALTWRDVELDRVDPRTGKLAPRLVLRWHMTSSGSAKAGTQELAFRPGTKASDGEFESVALSQRAVAALRAHRERLVAHKLGSKAWSKQAGKSTKWFYAKTKNAKSGPLYVVPSSPVAPDALVFPSADGTPQGTTCLSGWFERIGARAGVSKTMHGMRHDCGSFMLAAGVPLAVVSKHLRHSSPAFTAETYIHQVNEQQREGADAMDVLWASLEARARAV